MAKKATKANDPQEEKKTLTLKKSNKPDGAKETYEETARTEYNLLNKKKETSHSDNMGGEMEKIDYDSYSISELVEEFEKLSKLDKWYNKNKIIQEIISQFELKFKIEVQAKKDLFLKEGGNEIDFYFLPSYKNNFNQLLKDYKKKKRNYFQEREENQRLNLERKLEIIETLKGLINVDENINKIYKKFRILQESWHKTGPVPRSQSNNIWQTFKHHTEIFYDFLHLNRELRDLDFKHNYEEKIKIIEQAEKLSKIPDVLKASRDLNTLHRLWKNDLGPVAKEHRDELWARFQKASNTIHNRRQDFDKEYDIILEKNLLKKNKLISKLEEIIKNLPKNHKEWRKSIDDLNKIRSEFESIGQVTKKYNKSTWSRYRELSREINREKNKFYKFQKIEQRKNIELKKTLINEVKDILEKDDWNDYNNRMKEIQKDWKDIGFIQRKISNQLWEEFRSNCNLYFDRIKDGHEKNSKKELEIKKKKESFIDGIKDFKIPIEIKEFKNFSSEQWNEFIKLGDIKEISNKKLISSYNKEFSKAIETSAMNTEIKKEAKNHIQFFSIKDDENELNREIQNIKKKIDEVRSEIRQLENNMDYFSKSSNKNPLLSDVTTKLEELKSKEKNLKDDLVPLRKMKRDLDNNLNENNIDQNSDKN